MSKEIFKQIKGILTAGATIKNGHVQLSIRRGDIYVSDSIHNYYVGDDWTTAVKVFNSYLNDDSDVFESVVKEAQS
jgi:hypothetical protein